MMGAKVIKRKALVIDTSMLCVWLKVPDRETCGPRADRWNYERIDAFIEREKAAGAMFILPLAVIVETGNHISQAKHARRERALDLAAILGKCLDAESPWAAFNEQQTLWAPESLRRMLQDWPDLAAGRLSLGDMTIKYVAEYYAESGYPVEILTGDQGLKAYEPVRPALVPRRRK